MNEPASSISSSGTKSGKARGRKPGVKVPCDECIQRAGDSKQGGPLELCEKCRAVLHRPRRKLQDQPETKRVRRRSSAVVNRAFHSNRTIPPEPPELPFSDDQHEQHALEFFAQHSAPQLVHYFDSPFWERTVLQAARQEPAICHAIAAIGAAHEQLLRQTSNPQERQETQTTFAIEQCNKSIQLLVNPNNTDTKPDLRLVLTTCVLFTCFEALQGHHEQAIAHATQGYSLLQQYATNPESKLRDVGSLAVELASSRLLMHRLQTEANGLTNYGRDLRPDRHILDTTLPSSFESLSSARSSLEPVLDQLTGLFLEMDHEDGVYKHAVTESEKESPYTPWLAAWEEAFSDFLARNNTLLTPQNRRVAMILKAHHLVVEILSSVDLSLGACGWDALTSKFKAIVDLAAAVLAGTTKTTAPSSDAKVGRDDILSPNAPFSLNLGIIDPLYEVCSRCRDRTLRKRAIDLLSRHPRQGCVMSSWHTWKAGRLFTRIEEVARNEEDDGSTPSKTPHFSPTSEASIKSLSRTSSESQDARVGFMKSLPRVSARYDLNPGLYDDWGTDDMWFGQEADFNSVRSDSTASGMFVDEGFATGSSGASGLSRRSTSMSWTDVPVIRTFPPED